MRKGIEWNVRPGRPGINNRTDPENSLISMLFQPLQIPGGMSIMVVPRF